MVRSTVTLVSLAAVLVSAIPVHAAPPYIHFQGYLQDSTGAAVEDSGVYAINVSDPSVPVYAGRYHTPELARCVVARGNNLFIVDQDSLQIVSFAASVQYLSLGAEDLSHVVSHVPTIYWSNPLVQVAYEVEVGLDDDWTSAEMWSTGITMSSDTSVIYAGDRLWDGTTYHIRVRAFDGNLWGAWLEAMFRMNSPPGLPSPIFPPGLAETSTNQPTLVASVSPDAEADSQQIQFEVYDFDLATSLIEVSPRLPATFAFLDDTVSWVGSIPLIENNLYWWLATAWDGYEWSEYPDIQCFWVNAAQEAPELSVLYAPDGDSIVYTQQPELAWSAVTDPDPNDSVQYDLRVAQDSGFVIGTEIDSLTDTAHMLTFPLETGRRYWWKVISRDNHGLTAESEVETFRIYKPGDVNGSWDVTSADVIALVNYVFKGTPLPVPECAGWVNGDEIVNATDIIWLVNYVFKGGPAPAAGCRPAVTIADLVGTWDIEVWEYSRASDTSDRVDWVVMKGLSGYLSIMQDGSFEVTPALDGGAGSDHGTLTVEADSIYWDGENDEEWVRFELAKPLLTLRWPETTFVDMDEDGTPEDAWLRVVLRQS